MPRLLWDGKDQPDSTNASLSLDSLIFPQGNGYPHASIKNHLILGENLVTLSALSKDWEGKIDLIYADPPFFTNRRYPARIGRGEDSRRPQGWQLAEGYPDNWIDLDDYLSMLYPRLVLMHRLLAETGTLYLHLDWHANAYARLLLDEIFGADRLLNEIVWVYHGPSPIRSAFNRKHDTILVYTKSKDYTFNADAVRQPYDPSTVKTFASSPKAGFGKIPNLKRGKVPEDWWYFPVVARLHKERTGYPTQKPEALLERILLASSNPGDMVADFFCGSGTTAVAAARLDRRFIANDVSWRAVHTTRARLVNLSAPPFALQQASDGADAPLRISTLDADLNQIIEGNRVILDERILDGLDYWELDPAWNGKVFHSAAQAVRPRTTTLINRSLEIPLFAEGNTICLRLVNVDGKTKQIQLT